MVFSDQSSLTVEELEELTVCPLEPPNEDKIIEPTLTAKTILNIINSLENAVNCAVNNDPIIAKSLNFKRQCDMAIEIYENLYIDVLKRVRQSKLTKYFRQ